MEIDSIASQAQKVQSALAAAESELQRIYQLKFGEAQKADELAEQQDNPWGKNTRILENAQEAWVNFLTKEAVLRSAADVAGSARTITWLDVKRELTENRIEEFKKLQFGIDA